MGKVGRIPVRNLWLLMLYASDLTRIRGASNVLIDSDIDDPSELIARLLADAVERRLLRNLSHGYRSRKTVLARVRGRIDLLTTQARQLLLRGEVCCGFDELTIDIPRNRLVRRALDLMARLVRSKKLAQRCRFLAKKFALLGVGATHPSRAELAADQIGRSDASERFMLALAKLAFDLALPTEESGATSFVAPDKEEAWVRRLFEKAVLGFARVELEPHGWSVSGGKPLRWQVSSASEGLAASLPQMVTDIVLDAPDGGGRLVVDTKFTSILTKGRFREASLKSEYLYQMYAYLRSQEGREALWDGAAGMLLHPAVDVSFHEGVVIQGHPIFFATIDLSSRPDAIRNELRNLLSSMGAHAKSPKEGLFRSAEPCPTCLP